MHGGEKERCMSGTGSIKANTPTRAALLALRHGYQAIPIRGGAKTPHISAWTHVLWDKEDEGDLVEKFTVWEGEGATNVGLLLGAASSGLIDIDLDHPKTTRLRDHFLPPTAMRSGRAGRPMSHYWYVVEKGLPSTRRYKMPDGQVSVELRSTGAQTVIPPSVHPSGEVYRWEGEDWGGAAGPSRVDGQVLSVQVALLALGCVLVENWPQQGGRHDSYLALAGGLLRFGQGVHPFWERNLSVLVRALATATNDADGPDAREKEIIGTTLARLRANQPAIGFPRLAELIGADHAELVRRMAREVESLAGFSASPLLEQVAVEQALLEHEVLVSSLPPEERDPLGERIGTWQPVDLDPYLAGEVQVPQPKVLRRSDGHGLFYEGRVNSLYGQSEAAKSWVALIACQQEMALGERVMYLDFEDEPTFTLLRLRALGVGDDDIRHQFTYVRPEDPIKDMQKNRFGQVMETELGRMNHELFASALDAKNPALIIVDGMTVIYGLHGLDSNDAVSTDIITTWLKRLCRNGRSTVIVIDHTGKGAVKGSSPIGAHHKIAMVQGTALQVHPISQPMPGARGEVQLLVYKDRPGAVRAVSSRHRPAVAANIVLDSRQPNVTRVEIIPPDPDDLVLGDSDEDEKALVKAGEKLVAAAERQARVEERERAAEERERAAADAARAREQLLEEERQRKEERASAVLAVFGGDRELTLGRGDLSGQLYATKEEEDLNAGELKAVIADLVARGILVKVSDRRWTKYVLGEVPGL